MPLDEQAKFLMDLAAMSGAPPLYELSPEEARLQSKAAFEWRSDERTPEVGTADTDFPVPGARIPVRIYTPEGEGPFPVFVYFHGGGWVIGDIDDNDSICRFFTKLADCIVVSVGYRLAPEYKFPVPFEDAYAATEWVAENAASFGGDPARLAVGGDSAGGNFAAAISQRARDEHGPAIAYQVLIYPATDHYLPGSPSYDEAEAGYGLSRTEMIYFWDHYLQEGADADNPYISPLRAKDFSNLPAALVITAEFDPLRDEGLAYAEKLQAAGVPVEYHRYDGMMHGFLLQWEFIDKGFEALHEISDSLRAHLS
ncbi:MAG: alpha/beta hydrolase [Clostridiales Family XIII bacterium]|jgi:acetyl esterase|nr:alpha/beta hydrolase [Clostridiales Family XIII bacterium]